MQTDKNCHSIYSLFACFSDVVVTWPCDVIAVSHLLDMNVIHSYFQLVIHRHNIWLAGHHKTMAILSLLPMCTIDAGYAIMIAISVNLWLWLSSKLMQLENTIYFSNIRSGGVVELNWWCHITRKFDKLALYFQQLKFFKKLFQPKLFYTQAD